MSNVRIKITNTNSIKKKLFDFVKFSELPKISRVVRDKMRERIIPIIEKALRRNEIWRGLKGDYPGDEDRDIAAIVGLSNGDADQVSEWIVDVVVKSIVVQRAREGDSTLSITYDPDKIKKSLLSDEQSFYSSNEYIVPWLKWLLDGQGSVDGAFITFNIDDIKDGVSRSGRAFMIKSPGKSWSLNDHSFDKNPNFIIQVLSDKKVQKEINSAVIEEFNKAIKEYNNS
jgi:hypothetical protein